MQDIDWWRLDHGRPACFGARQSRAGADTEQLRQTEPGEIHSWSLQLHTGPGETEGWTRGRRQDNRTLCQGRPQSGEQPALCYFYPKTKQKELHEINSQKSFVLKIKGISQLL